MVEENDERIIKIVPGGDAVVATTCPNCGYHWTMVAAVSRSWQCPKCGRLRAEAPSGEPGQ